MQCQVKGDRPVTADVASDRPQIVCLIGIVADECDS